MVISKEHSHSQYFENCGYQLFWHKESPLSQNYPCRVIIDGVEYNCAEQYYMQQKACTYAIVTL